MVTGFEMSTQKARVAFPGFIRTVTVQGSRTQPQIPFKTASNAAAFVPTLERPEWCFFCDSSGSELYWIDNTTIQKRGGLGIVFRTFDPDSRNTRHGDLRRFGWALPLIVSAQIGEGVAIADAITLATEELKRAVNQYGKALPQPVVRIFTDSKATLDLLSGYSAVANDIESLKKPNYRVLEIIARESRYLAAAAAAMPGSKPPQLELHWLPSHIEGFEVDEHKLADAIAFNSKEQQKSLHILGRGRQEILTRIDFSSSNMYELMPDIEAYIAHLESKKKSTIPKANPTALIRPAKAILRKSFFSSEPSSAKLSSKKRAFESSSAQGGGPHVMKRRNFTLVNRKCSVTKVVKSRMTTSNSMKAKVSQHLVQASAKFKENWEPIKSKLGFGRRESRPLNSQPQQRHDTSIWSETNLISLPFCRK
ncbi:hypothetical protein QBC38DRAFT_521421 [Podospora fimiseda]|uniref:Uncharacterized protein n=1 Tax=Podospora fimiseda TaxID=252190 RepID=A0AAN7BF70_9PEZI|nr:hypothetical protein QBC38DRAFT_521421 [Podospora fimiseda]